MKNNGKRFEENLKKSVPSEVFFYRFRDSGTSFGSNDKVRFTPSNIADCELFDGNRLYLLELKSTQGKSLPLTNIRDNQIKELARASMYKNIISGIVIEFSTLDRAFFVNIDYIVEFLLNGGRKSISLKYCEEKGVEIEVSKKKINSTFNIKKLLEQIK